MGKIKSIKINSFKKITVISPSKSQLRPFPLPASAHPTYPAGPPEQGNPIMIEWAAPDYMITSHRLDQGVPPQSLL